ncbi:MAG: exo-alpha-sialidase [Prosthecobacter sp.]
MKYSFIFLMLLIAGGLSAETPAFRIEQSTVHTSTGEHHWSQSRAALIPGNPARVIITTQQNEKRGSHGYRDVFLTETIDGAKTWSAPRRIDTLARVAGADGKERVMGDICPAWHAATGRLLLTGKTFGFLADAKDTGAKDDRSLERVAYAVHSPAKNEWTGMQEVVMPERDHAGHKILEPNAGCNDRFDLPNGDILLPVRYRADPKTRQYTTIVARCTFDGEKLTYKEHGSELTFSGRRGLYEPSVIGHGGKFYLTMRADESAFVSISDDGLNYTPPAEWKYDDGKVLGSYNTQQHWITHGDTLWLIYTRRGASNDHVFRHRAPIFIAQVDPRRLCVLRATEQVLMPETGVDLGGGFAALNVNSAETWVISTEMAFPKGREDEANRIRMARIVWSSQN